MSDNYFVALGKKSVLWTFIPETNPFSYELERFKCLWPDLDSPPVQIVCSDIHAAILTKSRNVSVWWPFKMRGVIKRFSRTSESTVITQKEINRETARIRFGLHQLPALPMLPIIKQKGCITENEASPKLIKIAAVRGGLLGLTDKGHVLMIDPGPTNDRPEIGNWVYVSLFLIHFNLNSLNSILLFILESYRT